MAKSNPKSKLTNQPNFRTTFWFILSLVLIVMGISLVNEAINHASLYGSTNPIFGMGCLIFGGMILGVSVHVTYQANKKQNGKSSK